MDAGVRVCSLEIVTAPGERGEGASLILPGTAERVDAPRHGGSPTTLAWKGKIFKEITKRMQRHLSVYFVVALENTGTLFGPPDELI